MARAQTPEALAQAVARAQQEEAKCEALAWMDVAIQRNRDKGQHQRADYLAAVKELLKTEAA